MLDTNADVNSNLAPVCHFILRPVTWSVCPVHFVVHFRFEQHIYCLFPSAVSGVAAKNALFYFVCVRCARLRSDVCLQLASDGNGGGARAQLTALIGAHTGRAKRSTRNTVRL